VTWLFAVLALLVITGTALALAGRWRPEGLPPGPPQEDAPTGPRFDVVLRGYRMDQVDAELARLRRALAEAAADAPPPAGPDVPGDAAASRIEP
jgi:DivIVA domain-containing protein